MFDDNEDLDQDFDRDDDALMNYLEEERLALVPLDFLGDLMRLMEEHIAKETGLSKEELGPVVDRLEELLGEDGMMDLSLDAIVNWVNTLKDQ